MIETHWNWRSHFAGGSGLLRALELLHDCSGGCTALRDLPLEKFAAMSMTSPTRRSSAETSSWAKVCARRTLNTAQMGGGDGDVATVMPVVSIMARRLGQAIL